MTVPFVEYVKVAAACAYLEMLAEQMTCAVTEAAGVVVIVARGEAATLLKAAATGDEEFFKTAENFRPNREADDRDN